MGKRRKASICRRTAQSRVVERARLLDEVGAAGILGSNRAAAPPIPSSVPLNQTMLARPVSLTVQPLSSVPTMNAVEPDARSHPYSNRLPSPVSLLRAAVVASASESGTVGASIAAVHERHQEQTRKASYHHVAQPGDGRHESTSAEHHGVPSHPISDVTDRRPSKDADRSEGSEDNADFLGVQPRPLSTAASFRSAWSRSYYRSAHRDLLSLTPILAVERWRSQQKASPGLRFTGSTWTALLQERPYQTRPVLPVLRRTAIRGAARRW